MSLQKIGVEAVVDNIDGYKRAIKTFNTANDSASENVTKTAQKFDALSAATNAVGNVMQSVFSGVIAGVVMRALDAVAGAIGKVIDTVGNLAKNIFDSGLTFSSTMANISSVTKLTGKDLTNLAKDLIAIGADSAAGPQAVAEAYYQVAGGVADVSQRLPILEQAVALSEAGQANLKASTDGLINSVNAYSSVLDVNGKKVLDAARAADIFQQTTNVGTKSLDEYVVALGPLAGQAAALKIDFAELGGAMAFMTTKGFSAEQSATAIKNAMVQLSRKTPQVTRALKAMGEKSLEASIANHGLAGTLQLVAQGATKTHQNLTQILGSVEALSAVTQLGGNEFQKFFDTFIEGVDGATAAARELQRADVSFQLKLIGSRFSAIGLSISQAVLPAFNKFLTFINESFKKFDWKKIGAGLDKLGERLGESVGKLVDQLGTALGQIDWEAVASGIESALTSIGDFINNIDWEAVIQGAQNFVSTMITVGQNVVAFFSSAIQQGTAFVVGWNSFWAQVSGAVNAAMTAVGGVISGAQATISAAIQGVVDFIKPIWDAVFGAAGTFANAVSTAFTQIQTFITNALEPVQAALQPMIDALGNLWNSLFGESGLISSAVSLAWTAVQTQIDAALQPISDKITAIVQAAEAIWNGLFGPGGSLVGPIQAAWDDVKAKVEAAKGAISAAFKIIADAITSALKPAVDFINGIAIAIQDVANKLHSIGIGGGGGGGAPGGAAGGIMQPGLNIVGERGAEAIYNTGRQMVVISAPQTKRIMSGLSKVSRMPGASTARGIGGSLARSIPHFAGGGIITKAKLNDGGSSQKIKTSAGGSAGVKKAMSLVKAIQWTGAGNPIAQIVQSVISSIPQPKPLNIIDYINKVGFEAWSHMGKVGTVPIGLGSSDNYDNSVVNNRNIENVNFYGGSNTGSALERFARMRMIRRV